MKTIGMLGGMSWESSLEYYRIINEAMKDRLGGLHSAKSVMVSVDFAEMEALMSADRWDEAAQMLVAAAQATEGAGADLLLICTNTLHLVAEQVQAAVDIPLVHIADTAAQAIQAEGLDVVGLLGTRFTMQRDFYKGRLAEKFGLEVLVPDEDEQQLVDDVIFKELVLGVVKEESRLAYKQIVAKLVARGAQGIILGCTELPMLVKPEDSPVPLFDTTTLHAMTAVEIALAE